MYFKKIYMHGFKSFADPTALQLEPGITSIVGPNGCGKSNILDALRWALGEQSAKTLRGAHMQDVIFNGSGGRAPMGMAEVSLLFDNIDGQLPVEYSEVEVTRRIYRSGESEYLLNKTPCRLRDVQELFMDTGIGTNAYSLIGQGKIDLVLSSRPEDRRYLLEEAAGIIKYKTRKRIALRKLESAEQNMLRLGDIIAEVDRQTRSLKRQVNAAIRHRELTETLRALEIRNAWLHYNALSEYVTDLRARLKQATDQCQALTVKVNRQEAEHETFNLKRVEVERQLSARREKEHEVDSEMERLESRTALLRKEVEFAQSRLADADERRQQAATRQGSLREQQAVLKRQAEELRAVTEGCRGTLSARQEEHEQAACRLADAETRVEELRAMSLESANNRNRAQTEVETLSVNLAHVDEQTQSVISERAILQERLTQANERLREIRAARQREQDAFTEAVEARRELEQARRGSNEEAASLKDAWQLAREKKSSQEARLASLREVRDSYEGFAAGARAIMAARQQRFPGMDGIIGPIGDLLTLEKKYEPAIDAALGGNINNVVVEQADAAKSAIAFLKQHNAGRVTFLPLDTLRPGQHEDGAELLRESGVIGKAINYVQCEPRLLPAVQYLLYNTLLVETIDDAIRIARSGARFPRLVTLDGEVVTPAGAVTGGRLQKEGRGLLGRNAEIKELEEEKQKTQAAITNMESRMAALLEQAKTLGGRIQSCQEQELAFQKAINELGVAAARVAAEEENAVQAHAALDARLVELQRQRNALEARRAQAQSRVGGMAMDDEGLRQATDASSEAAQAAKRELETLTGDVADLRVRYTEHSRAFEEAMRDLERLENSVRENLEQQEKQQLLAHELMQSISEFNRQIDETLEQAKSLSEARDRLHTDVLETLREQHVVIDAVEQLARQIKDSRDKCGAIQREAHRLELECSQKEDRIAFFQERIAEEYGLGLASLKEENVGTDEHDESEREALIQEHRQALQRLGNVNLAAIEEYDALEKRAKFLKAQNDDLCKARDALLGVVRRIDATTQNMFLSTFELVSENFKNHFRRLFNGGQARLLLLDEGNPLECGIEIEARPPGKKPQVISLLSGGEQAMTAIALLFSIFSAKPSPFCVLDEVDAPLDDANISRFLDVVDEYMAKSQFIIITHNKQTMARSTALFGVTQQEAGVSQIVSARLEEYREVPTPA